MRVIHVPVCYRTTNCYLLCDEHAKKCAVIDPGGDAEKIIANIEESGCDPVAILLTHGHYDHTGGIRGLKERFDLPVYMNSADICENSNDRRALRLFPKICNTVNYEDGDTVTVGGLQIRVIATPGHTLGSVCLLVNDTIFTGDTIFAAAIGRTDLPRSDSKKMADSLKKLTSIQGDYKILPGHMAATNLCDIISVANYYINLYSN
ncbi:MAG: MBL fold metallo-hydrolase [Synergistaceae bacterium]|nr:MBL fold metallo-hydrolase [Synergistaceae bacterium]